MRSQIDTSMYQQADPGRSIGNALGLIGGISNVVSGIQERSRQNIEDTIAKRNGSDEQYLNEVVGKHMTGWNGNDQDDLVNRINGAVGEVATANPRLYGKIFPMIESVRKTRDAEQGRKIEQED